MSEAVQPAFLRLLEKKFGPLEQLGGGKHSHVYRSGERVIKVYREAQGLHELEAAHMRRAGLAAWVIDAFEFEGHELLVLRYFPGQVINATSLERALPALERFLSELYSRATSTLVQLQPVEHKLEQFKATLSPCVGLTGLDHLFRQIERDLELGRLKVEAKLTHLDLWQANILVNERDDVLIVDWARSAWDDPARDLAILKTGTLDLLPSNEALTQLLHLAKRFDVLERLPTYIALQTLHDLYWFMHNEPAELLQAHAFKLPRALEVIDACS